jgi:hypothetical protein
VHCAKEPSPSRKLEQDGTIGFDVDPGGDGRELRRPRLVSSGREPTETRKSRQEGLKPIGR